MPKITKQSNKILTRTSNQEAESAWDLTSAIKLLLYGRSGTGKTTLWASFPGPILAAICSGGTRPGELRSINAPEMRRKVDARIVRSTDQVWGLIEEAEKLGNDGTFVLDHGSGMQDLTLKEILGLDEVPVQRTWGLASQQQYGQSTIMCKELFRAMLSLPCNVVIVAQERNFTDESNNSELLTPTIGASLTPQLANWLNPACDYVLQTFIRPKMVSKTVKVGGKTKVTKTRGKGVEYCVRTEPHDVFITKFRVPKGHVLPDVIVDADYQKIVAIIEGKEG